MLKEFKKKVTVSGEDAVTVLPMKLVVNQVGTPEIETSTLPAEALS